MSLKSGVIEPKQTTKHLNTFERYLSLWVGACMVAGVLIGKLLPGFIDGLRRMEFGAGSQINGPIAVLIWLMIVPICDGCFFCSDSPSTFRPIPSTATYGGNSSDFPAGFSTWVAATARSATC